MYTSKTKVKYNENITKQYLYSTRHLDYDYFIDMFFYLIKSPSKGYKRMERHNQYYNSSKLWTLSITGTFFVISSSLNK